MNVVMQSTLISGIFIPSKSKYQTIFTLTNDNTVYHMYVLAVELQALVVHSTTIVIMIVSTIEIGVD